MYRLVFFVCYCIAFASLAELNWEYGNWIPLIGPCETCKPVEVLEPQASNLNPAFPRTEIKESQVTPGVPLAIRESLPIVLKENQVHLGSKESTFRDGERQFPRSVPAEEKAKAPSQVQSGIKQSQVHIIQAQPFLIQAKEDRGSGQNRVQLVYLPEGSINELQAAQVARIEGSGGGHRQVRPTRATSFLNFQQLPSFKDISPNRPTALIAEIGMEDEAQQQIRLLETALNSQDNNDVRPGELPRVFIAPTHIPPPPGYVKIPLLPSNNKLKFRESLPRTFLTSEVQDQLPPGFIQLRLPEAVSHLSHNIPFVHPNSSPLLISHFSPASTTQGTSHFNSLQPNKDKDQSRPSHISHIQQTKTTKPSSQSNIGSFQSSNHIGFIPPRPSLQESDLKQPQTFSFNSNAPVIPQSSTGPLHPTANSQEPEIRSPQVSSFAANQPHHIEIQLGNRNKIPQNDFRNSDFIFNGGFEGTKPIPQTKPRVIPLSQAFINPAGSIQQTFNPFIQTSHHQPHRFFQIGSSVIRPANKISQNTNRDQNTGFLENTFDPQQHFRAPNSQFNSFHNQEPSPQKNLAVKPKEKLLPQVETFSKPQPFPISNQLAGSSFFPPATPEPEIVENPHTESFPIFPDIEEENFFTTTSPPFRLSPKPITAFPSIPILTPIPVHPQTKPPRIQTLPPPIIDFFSSPNNEVVNHREDQPSVGDQPIPVTRGRKRLRPQGSRSRGPQRSRNRINSISTQDVKEQFPIATKNNLFETTQPSIGEINFNIPQEPSFPRNLVSSRIQRPFIQTTHTPTTVTPVIVEEESTLFPPFSVARRLSNKNTDSVDAEGVARSDEGATLSRARFGSKLGSESEGEGDIVEQSGDIRTQNIISHSVQAIRPRSQVQNTQNIRRRVARPRVRGTNGRPLPEWLQNRRRARVISRVRKVPGSENETEFDFRGGALNDVPEETEFRGAESANVIISRPPAKSEEKSGNSPPNLATHQVKESSRSRYEKLASSFAKKQAKNLLNEQKTENVELPTYFNDNENLPVFRLPTPIRPGKKNEGSSTNQDKDTLTSKDGLFGSFFDVASRGSRNPEDKGKVAGQSASGNSEPYIGSSAHIVYAVALSESPLENLVDKTTEEPMSDTITPDILDESLQTEKVMTESSTSLSTDEEEEPSTTEDNLQVQTDKPVFNFLDAFFSKATISSDNKENEVSSEKKKVLGQSVVTEVRSSVPVSEKKRVLGQSVVTEVRSSVPVICFSEGRCFPSK